MDHSSSPGCLSKRGPMTRQAVSYLVAEIGNPELRRTIAAATNTSEAWNAFIQWVAFGGDGIIRENSRDEQRKIIRYNQLVATLLVFHNAVSMTRALQELIDEGHPVIEEIITRLAPYRTDHINRFGARMYEPSHDDPKANDSGEHRARESNSQIYQPV
jgi:hypothetical protein